MPDTARTVVQSRVFQQESTLVAGRFTGAGVIIPVGKPLIAM